MADAATGRRALVIGAGIVGASAALYLQREGFRVTLLDKEGPGLGATYGNAGNLGISSCVPAALPGILKKIPRLLFNDNEPLSLRWTLLPRLVPWFLRFIAASRPERVERIADARYSLLSKMFEAYEPLLADANAQSLIRRDGLLHLFESGATLKGSRYVMDLRRRRGIRLQEVTGDQAREMEPALGRTVVGGYFLEDVAYTVNPHRLTQAFAECLVRRGGTLLRETARGFAFPTQGAPRVVTDAGAHEADVIVLAAGAHSRDLAAMLGTRVPLEAERGYHLMFPDPGFSLRMPVNSRDRYIAITPMEGGLRVSSMAEFAGVDAQPNWQRTEVILRKVKGFFPQLNAAGASRWMGSRPSLPDSMPIIARSPRHPEVLYAFGHDHVGVALGPITGKLIAELAAGKPASVDLAPFRPDRF